MNLQREAKLGVLLIVALLAGVAFDTFTGAAAPGRAPAAAPIFDQRSVYCPQPPSDDSFVRVVVAAATRSGVPVGVGGDDKVDLQPDRILTRAASESIPLVGYGGELVASAVTRFSGKVEGLASARCSKTASKQWYFAEGSSALGAEERIVIYNPFPDEAVVGISLFTPEGQQGNANLSDGIAVPAGETTVVELNRFIRQRRAVAAVVTANRGRVIAWRAMQESSEGRPPGVQFTLGATSTSDQWFLPEGAVGPETEERISLLNPTDAEAVATVSLASRKETVQPPGLVDVVIPPKTLRRIVLDNQVGGSDRNLGGAGVVIRTTSGELVVERTVYYDSDVLTGTASEIGAARTSAHWYLGPAMLEPDTDEVVLLNPGPTAATVTLSLLTEGADATSPGRLQDLTVQPGTQLKVSLEPWTRGATYGVRVESDREVVAERVAAQGGDVGAVMGVPLIRPSEP